jgi:hypothetical protein
LNAQRRFVRANRKRTVKLRVVRFMALERKKTLFRIIELGNVGSRTMCRVEATTCPCFQFRSPPTTSFNYLRCFVLWQSSTSGGFRKTCVDTLQCTLSSP